MTRSPWVSEQLIVRLTAEVDRLNAALANAESARMHAVRELWLEKQKGATDDKNTIS